MSNDWSTVDLKRQQVRGREIDALRKRYIEHRDALVRLAADAPTEALAKRYDDVRIEIETALRKLDELEKGAPVERETNPAGNVPKVAPVPPPAPPPPQSPASQSWDRIQHTAIPSAREREDTGLRTALILAIGIFVLAILGYFIYRYAFAEEPLSRPEPEIVDRPVITETTGSVVPEPTSLLSVSPATVDVGTVRKGTRVVRQVEVNNTSAKEMPIQVERSACRCLWFEYPTKLQPHETATLTVTVDGARASSGPLREEVNILVRDDPTTSASFQLTANVQ
ncbi:MAG TPA: DUF1573 domain-containing protein [Thermoanaerobaculia bacterium]